MGICPKRCLAFETNGGVGWKPQKKVRNHNESPNLGIKNVFFLNLEGGVNFPKLKGFQ